MKIYKFLPTILLFILPYTGFANVCVDELEIYTYHIQKSLDHFQNKFSVLDDIPKREEILSLLIDIRVIEIINSHKYQFVTAQDSRFFAYQVIAKELYERLNGVRIDDFEFLRFPNNGLCNNLDNFFSKYPFLKEGQKDSNNPDFDATPAISSQLISVSFSMETSVPADSALFVFLFGKGIADWMHSKRDDVYEERFAQRLAQLFEDAGIRKDTYQPYLEGLLKQAPKTDVGIINQFLLNKETIHKYLYISKSGGFFDHKNSDIHQVLSNFQERRMELNFDSKANLQARILAGTLFDGDVVIFRYTLIPHDQQESYKAYVKEIIGQILRGL